MNKLHDGAVVIRNLRIAKAGVFFPMPEARVVDESFGSRHRAAMGITEETDAVVVVVSEERGTISFCFNGNIASNLDGPKLRAMLEAIFSPKVRSKKRKSGKRPTLGSVIAEAEAPASAKPDSERSAPESISRHTGSATCLGKGRRSPRFRPGPRQRAAGPAAPAGQHRGRSASFRGPHQHGAAQAQRQRPSA